MIQIPKKDRITGAMAASAIGGALGNPTGLLTDDSQMVLFTTEGLILSRVRNEYTDLKEPVVPVFHSLLRWLYTQQAHLLGDMIKAYGTCSIMDGILMGHKELFALRNPSDTCLTTLSSGTMGTFEHPANQSRGPGALVRTLPVGLAFSDTAAAFDFGCRTAAITHGSPESVLASGFFAALISRLVSGQPLSWALTDAMNRLKTQAGHQALAAAIEAAGALSEKTAAPERIDASFKERTAVNTLAAGIYCARCHPDDLNRGVLLSVNHSGNCDETGAVTGAILGALNGIDAVPASLLESLELKDVIVELSSDLLSHFHPDSAQTA